MTASWLFKKYWMSAHARLFFVNPMPIDVILRNCFIHNFLDNSVNKVYWFSILVLLNRIKKPNQGSFALVRFFIYLLKNFKPLCYLYPKYIDNFSQVLLSLGNTVSILFCTIRSDGPLILMPATNLPLKSYTGIATHIKPI